jgi:hypothetical protein
MVQAPGIESVELEQADDEPAESNRESEDSQDDVEDGVWIFALPSRVSAAGFRVRTSGASRGFGEASLSASYRPL